MIYLQIKDGITDIPAVAIPLKASSVAADAVLRNAEFIIDDCGNAIYGSGMAIILVELYEGIGWVDPNGWTDGRTMKSVHWHLINNWNSIVNYANQQDRPVVIDVKKILGEK